MEKRSYIHSHIHNNIFQPDSAIFAKVENESWKKDYDLEILATRHLGNNLHLIVSIPHFIYGFQRYDLVAVDEKTDMITNLEHRGRNTSVRFVFHSSTSEQEQKRILEHLVNIDCSLDPASINLIAIDLDNEDSREILKQEMNMLLEDEKILDWEYVVQD